MEQYINNSPFTTDVDYLQLIDKARKFSSNSKDILQGEFWINLSLASPNLDISSKIDALKIKALNNSLMKNENCLLYIAQKCLKMVQEEKRKYLDTKAAGMIMDVLYEAAVQLEEKKAYIISFQYLVEIENLYFHFRCYNKNYKIVYKKISDVRQLIEKEANELRKQFDIFQSVNSDNLIFAENKEKELKRKISEFKSIMGNSNSNLKSNKVNDGIAKDSNDDKVYLASSLWIKNLIQFIAEVERALANPNDYYKFLNTAFFPGYIEKGLINERAEFGFYPGKIDNKKITVYKDYWYDPDVKESQSNVFLNNNLKEGIDFAILCPTDWRKLKSMFGCTNEIERTPTVLNTNQKIVEVYLRKFKVIVLNDLLRKKQGHLITARNIQLSKTHNVQILKGKLVRCLQFELNPDIVKHDSVKLFLVKSGMKRRRNVLFEMTACYQNLLPCYKLNAELLDENDKLIEDLKFDKGDFLICEIETDFIQVIANDDLNKCSFCNGLIQKVVRCASCESVGFCSDECMSNDMNHKAFHSILNPLYKKKFHIRDLLGTQLESLVGETTIHGRVGLTNLGNTCFMNSALQCLSHSEDLTKYFLLKKVFDEINRSRVHGTGGDIAKAYYELMKELWQGDTSVLSPTDFRLIFIKFAKQFAGFSQHDSHEMLTFMLDALHEDLNRVKEKRYIEQMEDGCMDNDKDVSRKRWTSHLLRENSIIVDLFHGQYKSMITCLECGKVSITYDPFMYLGLPIPSGNYRINFKYFQYLKTFVMKEIEMQINSNTTVKEMKEKTEGNPEFMEALVFSNEKIIINILKDDELIFEYFDQGKEICIYDVYSPDDTVKENLIHFYIYPSEFIEVNSFYFLKTISPKILSYPILITLRENETVEDLFRKTFIHLRRIIPDSVRSVSSEEFYGKVYDRHAVKNEFNAYFSTEEDLYPFNLHIVNNVPKNNSYTFFSSKPNCEFCGEKCDYCKLTGRFKWDDSATYMLSRQRVHRPFILYAQMLKLNKKKKVFDNMSMPITISSNELILKQSEISIYDCLDLFRSEERLDNDNAWYCNKCQKHQSASKKIDIMRHPLYLIIQFKRFKIRTTNSFMAMISNRKNDSLISYPEKGLDLKNYVLGSEKDDAIYDLYAISQHYGGLSTGHYTALCKNFGNWYEYDDESVNPVEKSEVVTYAAYMLFYKKRIENQ